MRRRTLLTMACSFLGGLGVSMFAATRLVPAHLPVEYLTPITLAGVPLGLIFGGALTRFSVGQPGPPAGR
jgi:hypothetical protein